MIQTGTPNDVYGRCVHYATVYWECTKNFSDNIELHMT